MRVTKLKIAVSELGMSADQTGDRSVWVRDECDQTGDGRG
jgi:hypothetical protein